MYRSSKINSIILFFLKTIAFLCFLCIVDLIFGSILKKFYFKQQSGYDYLTTYAIEKTEADIMVLGSSRAVNIFNPLRIQEQTNLSCYNAGRYGEPIFYHFAVLKCALNRYSPKLVLLSFDAGNFSLKKEAYERVSVLLPYYQNHPEIRPVVHLKRPFEKIKLLSRTYPYNSKIASIIAGCFKYQTKSVFHLNGFIPVKKTFAGPAPTINYSHEKLLDLVKVDMFRQIIRACVKSGVRLIVVCPPYFIKPIGTDLSIIEAKRITEEHQVSFLDYSRDTTFTDHIELFADYRHLNQKGVELFSNTVIREISKKL